MNNQHKNWPPTLVIAESAELQAEIIRSFAAAGFNDVIAVSESESESALIDRTYGLLAVSWLHQPDSAAALIEKHRDNDAALLSLVSHLDQQVVQALKVGSDSVAIYPRDLDHIALSAILAFDRARIRSRVASIYKESDASQRLGNARIRSVLHDLKNPLTVTMGNLQVIQAGSPDSVSEGVRRMVNNALRGCHLQLTMIANISDLIKIEEGRFHCKKEVVDLEAIVRRQVAEFAANDSRKEFTFAAADTAPVEADPLLLERIFHNLLAHCAHYSRQGSHISVTMGKDPVGANLIALVVDDGEPIPPELGDEIFGGTPRALDSQSLSRWDRGMMLAFARAALRVLGGDASLDGISEVGVRFKISIPCQP